MHPEQTTTPLRQLYFIIQTMLIDPINAVATKQLFDDFYHRVCDAVPPRQDLRGALAEIRQSVEAKRYFDALKTLRGCFAIEDGLMVSSKLEGAHECR